MTEEKELALDQLISTWRAHSGFHSDHPLLDAIENYLNYVKHSNTKRAEPFHFERGQLYQFRDPLSDAPFVVFATSNSIVDEYGYTWTLAEAQELIATETWKTPECLS